MTVTTIVLTAVAHWLAGGIEYEFVPDTNRLVGVFADGVLKVVRLDQDGVFRLFKVITTVTYSGRYFPQVVINSGNIDPTPVYEFRKGVLYPGNIRVGGEFVPDPTGVAVRFADYRYTPHAVRIYNLPGYFRLVPKAASVPPARGR